MGVFGGTYMSASCVKIAGLVGTLGGALTTVDGTVPLNIVLNLAQLVAIAGFLIYLGRREEQWRQHVSKDFNEQMMLDWILRTQAINTPECVQAHGWRGATVSQSSHRRSENGVP